MLFQLFKATSQVHIISKFCIYKLPRSLTRKVRHVHCIVHMQ